MLLYIIGGKMTFNIVRITYKEFLVVFLFFLFFGIVVVGCSIPQQTFSIIFSANLGGNQDLYRISSSNFQILERITHTPNVPEKNLKLSKDGKRFIYSIPVPNLANYSIVVELKTDTKIELDTPFIGSGTALGWSANGDSAILLDENIPQLYYVKIEEKKVEELDIPHNYDFSVITDIDFSSDGKYLAYTEYHQVSSPLSTKSSFILDTETKQVVHLISDKKAATCDRPLWSPTREQLLLYCNLDSTDTTIDRHVYLLEVSVDGSLVIDEIADVPCHNNFAWSSAGNQFIAYCKVDNTTTSLVIYNSDGSVNRMLGMIDMRVWEMSWSPDGQHIIYIAGQDRNYANIYIMDSDGSNNHTITTEPSNYSQLLIYSLEP
jgi:Tol biopolymer transport system component